MKRTKQPNHTTRIRSRLGMGLAMAALLMAGCDRTVQTEYGRIVGRSRGRSLNGTGVLYQMFEDAGARVRPASRLGRVFDRSDVVVWIPDRFRPPEKETRQRIDRWLREEDHRTLVFVGRDFDAATVYWDEVRKSAPAEQDMELRRQSAQAKVAHARARAGFPTEQDCDWFVQDRAPPPRVVQSIQGEWSDGINAELADLRLHTRIRPSQTIRSDQEDADRHGQAEMEILLESQGDMLVGRLTRSRWRNSQIIVVANGSWLLNAPLVNHEHRKLAGKLIRQCRPFDRVTFLISGPTAPSISDAEPNRHHGLAAFTVWPVNCILVHLFVLGIVYLFSVFPIFGRPRELDDENVSDFGKHIKALGALLSLTHDREFARQRREYFEQRVVHETASLKAEAVATVVPTPPPESQKPIPEKPKKPDSAEPSTKESQTK